MKGLCALWRVAHKNNHYYYYYYSQFFVVDVVEHLRQIDVDAVDYVSNKCTGCVNGNVIGVLDQVYVQRWCWKFGQIVIEERWRQNSTLCHSCFHLSALRFLLPKMNVGSSVMYIVLEPATESSRYFGIVDKIDKLLMVHIVECSCLIELEDYCSISRRFS